MFLNSYLARTVFSDQWHMVFIYYADRHRFVWHRV